MLFRSKDTGFSSTDNITNETLPTWDVDISGNAVLVNGNPAPLQANDIVYIYNKADLTGGVPNGGATPIATATVRAEQAHERRGGARRARPLRPPGTSWPRG